MIPLELRSLDVDGACDDHVAAVKVSCTEGIFMICFAAQG